MKCLFEYYFKESFLYKAYFQTSFSLVLFKCFKKKKKKSWKSFIEHTVIYLETQEKIETVMGFSFQDDDV